jgi:hypothetical protein
MNRRAFVLVNRMRAGCSSLKASLSRIIVGSTAEWECGNWMQTGKHYFWECKLYEDQRAILIIILSEKKKRYPKSVTYGGEENICSMHLLVRM